MFLGTWTGEEDKGGVCRPFSVRVCPVFFSWVDWDCGFGEEHTGHSHHTVFKRKGLPLSGLDTVDTDLGHPAQLVLSGFSSAELPLPHLGTILFGRTSPRLALTSGVGGCGLPR